MVILIRMMKLIVTMIVTMEMLIMMIVIIKITKAWIAITMKMIMNYGDDKLVVCCERCCHLVAQ